MATQLDAGEGVGEPLRTRFGSLEIAYDGRVLAPREWTTLQSQWARELLASAPAGPVLELCSGVGHIGLLAVEGTDRRLVCVDLDPVACDFAVGNAAAAGRGDRVEVRNLALDAFVGNEVFAVVVADPPWVPRADVGRFPEDPVLAIDGGDDGLALARECVRVIDAHLHAQGTALLQVGSTDQASALAAELPDSLVIVEIREHLRGVLARLVRGPSSGPPTGRSR